MKELLHTQEVLQQLTAEGALESYAVMVGYGDQEWTYTSEDVNMDTFFDMASVGKVFPTSTLILHTVSEGKMELTDTLAKFFPEVPEDKKHITVFQLLTHSSGLIRSRFPKDAGKEGRKSVLRHIFSQPVVFESGTRYAYSCDGFILLGFILERVYGKGLDELFRELIVKPLGMTRSRYLISIDEENAACCYHYPVLTDTPIYDDNLRTCPDIPAGTGEDFSTPHDTRIFVKAIMNRDERLYRKELFALAEQNHTKDIPCLENYVCFANHGLGYEYVDEKCPLANVLFPEGSFGKEGWTGQTFFISREKGLYVIILSNAMRRAFLRNVQDKHSEVDRIRTEIHRAIGQDLGI